MSLALAGAMSAQGQVQNNGSLYVSDNASFHIASGSFNFGASPATTKTTKTASIYGNLSFASGATWSNAGDAHYADGYVRHYGTDKFLFPLGDAGIYAPLEATASNATGIDAAYFNANPSAVGTALDATVAGISTIEYWNLLPLVDAQAKISLTWRTASNIATVTGNNLNKLTIAGWDGSKWVEIPSRTDATSILGGASTLTAGSITSTSNVNLAGFKVFTFAQRNDLDCYDASITYDGVAKYWLAEGWSTNSTSYVPTSPPSNRNQAHIYSNAPVPSFSCFSLTLRSDLVINPSITVDVLRGLTYMSGKIVVKDGGSFIRWASSTTVIGTPTVVIEKTTRNMRMNDYIYWGAPVNENAFTQINGALAEGETVAGAFDLKYKYVPGVGGGWQALTATAFGEGFITRVKNQAPFTQQGVAAGKIQMTFTGSQKTGTITVPVKNNPSSPNGATSYNLIANPYPSPIDLDKFLIENLDIDGAAYVWTSATDGGNSNNPNTSYTASDYAVYNLAGQVNTSPLAAQINGRISIAQGFKVKSLVNSGTVTFNNCMRTSGIGVNFFRQAEENNKNSFKLNMTAEGIYSEILIAYIPEATMGYDRLYDAGRNSTSPSKLYSILEENNTKLAINSRPQFVNTDVVPLGVSKTGTAVETFKINISDKGGIFRNDVPVYLHDKALQVYHNFANGEYSFTTSEAIADTRFEVVYENVALSNPDFSAVKALASIKNGQFNATASLGMNAIEIYDITGRKVMSFDAAGQNNTSKPFGYADGIYIAKIKLDNGAVVTQKLIAEK